MRPFQKINHFPGMQSIARKNLLAINLKRLQAQFPGRFDFVPDTWLLPSEYAEFRAYYESVGRGKARTYIVKPEAMSQGQGIFLTRSIQAVETGEKYVVQRYIKQPYLIEGLKFDLRIYVLVAGSHPLRLYLFEEGLARFATEPYQPPCPDNLENLCCHLTNYAINKLSDKFVFNTSETRADVGHKRSLTSVYRLLQARGEDVARLKAEINDIIVKTLLSGQQEIEHQYNACQPDNPANNMCF
jgi:tubulin polyglutamylase TTLL6/13